MNQARLEQGEILLIDKPLGWTSFQVVNKIKWQLKRDLGIKKFKIGHAGTLDPLASGLLLVCVGKATKRIDELQQGTKCYTGTIVLGATTPCYDLEQAIDQFYPYEHLTREVVQNAVDGFVGKMQQVPPMFSAIKVEGARAYSYARDGVAVEIEPKEVELYQFEITDFRPGDPALQRPEDMVIVPLDPEAPQERELYRKPQGRVPAFLPQVDFRISCSKGTYIRSIARDLGLALGSGGFLSALRRERIGDFEVSNALPVSSGEPVPIP